jgi:hypothetical protein
MTTTTKRKKKKGPSRGAQAPSQTRRVRRRKKKQKKEPEKVQYCHVNWEQRERVKEYSDGENVIVWFQEKKRYAWLAHSVKQQGGEEKEE